MYSAGDHYYNEGNKLNQINSINIYYTAHILYPTIVRK